ncbi:outer membrane beta-barrel protein [Vibrio sp. CK2-1]|uniref:outer membrane beta-barrel protein n=1 Tax=Vibrio sp. CK2-1 TaxID=2912249 RepID=UPI001F31744E|nr:outer membrane beta-barrel protein [Vibrio sp. CK2-1]MCF7353516.1 outer membrane beta-barrel protein [Vibrio sp. CK2-1]
MSLSLYSWNPHLVKTISSILIYSASALLSFAYASTSKIGEVQTVPQSSQPSLPRATSNQPPAISNGPNRPANSDKVWDRILPIGGQVAIYNGYDLPLPFGISFLYSHIEQDQTISNMKVGYGGPANVDIDFLSFDNFRSKTNTPQLKLDAWVLPFLNVFATVGKIKGTIDINMSMPKGSVVTSDPVTNAINDGIQAYCAKNPRKCKAGSALLPDTPPDIFGGDPWTLSAEAEIEGYNYSLGAMLAGASGDWFYTMPIVYTQTNMEKTKVSGGTINIQPRVGYTFDLNHGIDLNLYTGASYMDINQTLKGGFNLETMEASQDFDAPHTIAFEVHQENTDKWGGIVGFNVNVNKHLSAAMEYTGIIGDRRQLILMVNGRF